MRLETPPQKIFKMIVLENWLSNLPVHTEKIKKLVCETIHIYSFTKMPGFKVCCEGTVLLLVV